MVGGAAVERHGQNARDGRLPYAAMAAEDVPMRDTLLGNCILQRARDVLLPDDIRKALRTILTGEDLIAHGGNWSRLYRRNCNRKKMNTEDRQGTEVGASGGAE